MLELFTKKEEKKEGKKEAKKIIIVRTPPREAEELTKQFENLFQAAEPTPAKNKMVEMDVVRGSGPQGEGFELKKHNATPGPKIGMRVLAGELPRGVNIVKVAAEEFVPLVPLRAISIEELVERGMLKEIKEFLWEKGFENILDFLNTEEYGQSGDSLLHLAVRYRQAHIVSFLRKFGVSLERLNDNNETPLHYAALFYDKETFAELLRFPEAILRLDEKGNDGLTACDMAKSLENEEFFEMIGNRHREILDENYKRGKQSSKINKRDYYKTYGSEAGQLLVNIEQKKYEAKKKEREKAMKMADDTEEESVSSFSSFKL